MRIPMVDLAVQWQDLREEVEAGLREVMERGQFILGPNVEAFEQEVAVVLGVRHAVACGSGTDALQLALLGCGIGPGDEVITTPFSFFATVEAILHAGAVPVFVDIDPDGFNIDPDRVEAAITPATRAILPVHLYGRPAPMERLLDIARRHRLRVVEDCAQAFGARRGERPVGGFGDAGCFSFFPAKNLGAFGDGGLVATDDETLAARVRELGNHGSRVRYHHLSVGFNSRLDELQAVVLRAKLSRIDRYNAARRELAGHYDRQLQGLPGVVVPRQEPGCMHVFQQYTLLLPDRDRLARELAERGIASAVHYPLPLHRQPALAARYAGVRMPVAEQVARECLSLPMYPELGRQRAEEVADAVREIIGAEAASAPPAARVASRAG
jgi:dTDP-4-amino-4,6-dideoxygalactose transaminase